jgi:hypothetical protein
MNIKLTQFIKRNKKRNAHLYKNGVVEGYDYVICPISGERLSMIKENYITNILGMVVEEYPITQRICNKRKENIQQGLKQIDTNTGLSKYELGQIKARKILKEIDSAGLSGYDRKGQKTRATHMNNIDEFGRNGYSQLASNAIIKGNRTKASKGIITDPTVRPEFYRYKTIVSYLTEKYRDTVSNGYITGLAGKLDAYHIDHMYSILEGYKNKVSPLIIGNIENLQMIPWEQNLAKSSRSSLTIEKLLTKTNYSKEQSRLEFDKIIELIRDDLVNRIPVTGGNILERFYATAIR